MNFKDVQPTLRRITYKAKVWFDVERSLATDNLIFRMLARRPDAREYSGPEIDIVIHKSVPEKHIKDWDQRILIGFVGAMIRESEMHEIDEWFKFDGENVKEPHPELVAITAGSGMVKVEWDDVDSSYPNKR